tara:strand:- start:365 stop:1249 length:885 start_codon:yes stop_codon:yes gene_type:complete
MPKRTILDEKLKADYGLTASTIEDVDRAVYNFINDDLNVFCDTNEGFQKVPVIFASPERAYQIKNDPKLRNERGRTLEYPLISIIRSSITNNPANKGRYGVNIPPYYDFYKKGGSIPIARRVMQSKSREFANATSLKKFGGGKNTTYKTFPFDNQEVVYETLYAPMPTYIEVQYEIKMITDYQQQMNQIVAPFLAQFSTPAVFSIKYESHTYEAFVEPAFSSESNNAGLGTEERQFKTTASIKVLGHIMGADKNQETPVTIVRESAVEVKIGRERTVLGTEPEFKAGRKDKYRP